MGWSDLEREAPEVAALARGLLERHGWVYAGTIRRDGTPRISPVEVHLVAGELAVVMIAGTLKARDVLRDPRVVLNTPVLDPADPGAELKLRGRLGETRDEALRGAVADAVEERSGWRPKPGWHVLTLDLEDVAHIAWERGEMRMTRWSRGRGVERVVRPVAVL